MNPSLPIKWALLTAFALGAAVGGTTTWRLSRQAPHDASSQAVPTAIKLPGWSGEAGTPAPSLAVEQSRRSVDGMLGLRGDYATRVDTLRALLVVLPDDGYPRLLSGLAAQDNDESRRLLNVALRAWIDRDPAAATRWAVLGKQPGASMALRSWIKTDPVAAAEWVATLTDAKQLRDFSHHTLPALVEQDQERALALVMALPDDIRPHLLRTVVERFAQTDPVGTIRRLGAEVWDNGNGYHILSSALREWAKTDPRAAIDWLAARPSRHSLATWIGHLMHGEGVDWRQIAMIAIEMPTIENRQQTLANLLSNQGRQDPASVIRFLDATGDTNLRNRVLLAMASSYSGDEMDKTLPFALALPESADRNHKLGWLLSAWAKKDPTAALDWMSGHDDPGVASASAAVQTGILVNIARQDPLVAIEEWSAIESANIRKDSMQLIAEEWAKSDPAAAVQWLFARQLELLPEAGRSYIFSGYNQMIFAWRKSDPEAALRWVEQARQSIEGSVKNQVIHSHADPFKALGGDWNETADRASTAQLLTKINNADMRAKALENHVRDWLKFDRKTATEWLEKNPMLSAERTAALLIEADQPGSGTTFNPF